MDNDNDHDNDRLEQQHPTPTPPFHAGGQLFPGGCRETTSHPTTSAHHTTQLPRRAPRRLRRAHPMDGWPDAAAGALAAVRSRAATFWCFASEGAEPPPGAAPPARQPAFCSKEPPQVLAPDQSCDEFVSEAGRCVRATLYQPSAWCSDQPCFVVYCPAESRSGGPTCDVQQVVDSLLPLRVAVFALDVSAAGGSAFCELGDVASAVRRLREHHCQGGGLVRVALWGRSAGAVAALRYAQTDPAAAALVCDGAYSDLPSLLGLPHWMASPLFGLRRLAADLPDVACSGGQLPGRPPADAPGSAAAAARSPPFEVAPF